MEEEKLFSAPEKEIAVGESLDTVLDNFEDREDEYVEDGVEGLYNNDQYKIDTKLGRANDGATSIADATPFDGIKYFAGRLGIKIKDNPNKSCKKCYGRGYTGMDSVTKIPVPCRCIFFAEDLQARQNQTLAQVLSNTKNNRAMRRKFGL